MNSLNTEFSWYSELKIMILQDKYYKGSLVFYLSR